jgi:hypothetical protein
MVVVPTSNHVHLHYVTTSVEYTGYGMTLIGIVLVIALARVRPLVMPEPPADSEEVLGRFLSGGRDDEDDDYGDGEWTSSRDGPPVDLVEPEGDTEDG